MPITQSTHPARATAFLPVVFVATIFLSASLLFFVQPLFTKIVLPQIGGSPAVWTTAMLFFQTILIAGYLYAHVLTRHVPMKFQVWVHLAVWAIALTALPLTLPEAWSYNAEGSAVWQTLMLFAIGVGLPFFALSANAPLLQHWYGQSDGPSASDPYFLYGASNLGSLVALLGFPLVAEPLFGATDISLGWAAGFVALGLFLMMSGVSVRNNAPVHSVAAADKLKWTQIAGWAFLAFIPSSLMLSVTSKISQDAGSFPLVWVIPLSLYLLSFVIAFSNRHTMSDNVMRGLTGVFLVLILLQFMGVTSTKLSLTSVGTLFFGFFMVAIYAHRRLYQARPDAAHLTVFYLTMSVGGALGGVFNSIVAPIAFDGLYEAGTTALLALLLLPRINWSAPNTPRYIARGVVVGALFALPMLAVDHWQLPYAQLISFAALAAATLYITMRMRANMVAFCCAALTVFSGWALSLTDKGLFRDRSFFGSHIVWEDHGMRLYSNGTTIHGAQRLTDDDAERPEPLFYYHPNAPMAQVLNSPRGAAAQSVGVVGLGIGSLACYRKPHQDWQFYEIDALVDQIARRADMFGFMTKCAGDAPTHLGDARVVLAGQEGLTYDILIIDAYSSDAVPLHLTTNEAIELYLDRLAPGGILIFHISNRYYAIDRPLARSAEHLGLSAWIQRYGGNKEQDNADLHSTAVMLTRKPADIGGLAQDDRWEPLRGDGQRIWTDDFANLLSILK